MKHLFKDKKISGILTILPPRIVDFQNEVNDYPFPEKQSLKLATVMGYNTRRICSSDDSVSDYATYGINYLLKNSLLKKEDISAIVVVTSSQDHIIPPASYLIQGKIGLSKNTLCYDISQACGGYIIGLTQAFMLLDTFDLNKVILVSGDMLSKKVGKRDRSSRPIIGDAVNITIVENSLMKNNIPFVWENFGEDAEAIIINAGGLKYPSNEKTAVENIDNFGNYRSQNDFFMNGEEVFNFVMERVPLILKEVIEIQNLDFKQIDYFLFHQPNRYMVHKLCDEAELPYEKVFSNIVELYGNSSTATIPLNICHNIAEIALSKQLKVCMSGFGAGLTCNTLIMNFDKFEFCNIINYKNEDTKIC